MTNTVWMYYQTDDDSGYYNIRLFWLETDAKAYKTIHGNGYSEIKQVQVT